MEKAAELFLDAKAALGEGPHWDHRSGLLYWVDIIKGEICSYDSQSGITRTFQFGDLASAVVPREQGSGFVVAAQSGLYHYDPESGSRVKIADPEKGLPSNRFNDGKCDAKGRFWAGTLGMGTERHTGALYCMDDDGTVKPKITGVTCSNGIAWSLDQKTMYYIDTMTRQVAAYHFDLPTGELAYRGVVIEFSERDGLPDGMTIDAEGKLWIAHWGGWQVSRWDPETSRQLEAVRLPVSLVTSCTFGGPDLDELYITSARVDLSDEEQGRQPHAGGLFRVRPGVKGLPANHCAY